MEQYPITLQLKVPWMKAVIGLGMLFTGCWMLALSIIINWEKFQNSTIDSLWAIMVAIGLLGLPTILIPVIKQLLARIEKDKIYCIRGIDWTRGVYESNEINRISIRAKMYRISLPSICYYLLIQKESEKDAKGYKLLIEDRSLYGAKLSKNNLNILLNEIKRLNPHVIIDESVENYLKTGSIKTLDDWPGLEKETWQKLGRERKITYSIIIILLISYTIYYFF